MWCGAVRGKLGCVKRSERGRISATLRKFWSDNLVLGIATLIAGLFNYLYHVVLAHVLGPRVYGDLMTFLNLTWLLVLPGPVVTLIYTRVGQRPAQARKESWWLWGAGVALWLLVWSLALPLSRILHLRPLLLIVFTGEVVPLLALAANQGMLQRARCFVWVGTLAVVNNAFRVLAAGAIMWTGARLLALGGLEVMASWTTWMLSRYLVQRLPRVQTPSSLRLVAGTASAGILSVLLATLDSLIAKHSLGPEAAGQYTGLATIGHTLQFIGASLGTVMLTSILAHPDQRRKYLWATLGIYSLLAVGAEIAFSMQSSALVRVILGPSFLAVAPFLVYYGAGMVALGGVNLVMLYSVARRRWEVIGTVSVGVGIWIWQLLHAYTFKAFVQTTTTVMGGTLVAILILMVAVQWWLNSRGRDRRRASIKT